MKTVDMVTIGLWVAQLIQCVMNIIYCSRVLHARFSAEKTMALFVPAQIPYIIIAYFWIDNGFINWICAASYFAILCRIFYTDSWKRIVAAICGLYLLIFLTTFITAFIFQLFSIRIHELMDGMLETMGNFLFSFVFLIILYIFIFIKERQVHNWSSRDIMSLVIFSVIQMFLVQAVAYLMLLGLPAVTDFILPNAAMVAGTVLCMVADILLFRMLLERSQKERLAVQLEVMEKQSQLELTYYTSVNQKLQEVRKIRHDFNNQLQTAYGVLAQGNPDEAKTQLLQLEERIAGSSPVYYCPNPILNAILWEKGKEAEAGNIIFETEVRLPEQVGIEKVDLCSLFSNLLDNGLKAAAQCTGERRVSVRAFEQGGYCVVQVENTAAEKETPEIKTPRNGHGYGLTILKTIAQRYNGKFTTEKMLQGVRTVVTLKLRQMEGDSDENADL